MSRFLHHTLDDLRGGRTSWRVYLALSVPALIAGVAASMIVG